MFPTNYRLQIDSCSSGLGLTLRGYAITSVQLLLS